MAGTDDLCTCCCGQRSYEIVQGVVVGLEGLSVREVKAYE